MSRYYTCAKCDNLVKENEDCPKCAPKPTAVGVLAKLQENTPLGSNADFAWIIDDANYTDDDGMGD